MAKNFIDKETMVISAGAGIGVIQTIVMKEYVDANFGPIPYISDVIPAPWNRWSTFGNIVIGGVLFGLTSFTSIVRDYTLNSFLKVYGVTTLVGGVVNGIFPASVPAARARLAPLARPRPLARAPMNMTPTGIPSTQILA